jgi:hypothetical protein
VLACLRLRLSFLCARLLGQPVERNTEWSVYRWRGYTYVNHALYGRICLPPASYGMEATRLAIRKTLWGER